jgi:hypothetical protein
MENRSGLIVRTAVTTASGTGEREAAKSMVQKLPRTTRRISLGGDKGYDTEAFVKETAPAESHTARGTEQQTPEIGH